MTLLFRTNEAEVGVISIPFYPGNISTSPYPSLKHIRYPKSGTPNPKVTVIMYSFATKNTSELVCSLFCLWYESHFVGTWWLWVRDGRSLAFRFSFTREVLNTLFLYFIILNNFRTLNRGQNIERMLVFDAPSFNQVSNFVSQNAGDFGWILPAVTPPVVINSTLVCVLRNNSGFAHVALVNVQTGALSKWLTSGDFDVTDILAYHPASKTLYVLTHIIVFVYVHADFSSVRKFRHSRGIWTASTLWAEKFSEWQPRKVHTLSYTSFNVIFVWILGYYSASFSKSSSYAVLSYLGPNIPDERAYLFNGTHMNELYYLSDNSILKKKIENYDLPRRAYTTVKSSLGDVDLNAYTLTPPRSSGSQFGLLLNVYVWFC